MKIVLRADVDGVGVKGDILDVADGHARNYLIPQGLAFQANSGVTNQAQAMRAARDLKDSRELAAAQEIASRVVPMTFEIPAKAGDTGKLFGSIGPADVVAAVAVQANAEIDRKHLQMSEPIKELGSHSVRAKLRSDVEFDINVEVVATS